MNRSLFGSDIEDSFASVVTYRLAGTAMKKKNLEEAKQLYRECLRVDRNLYGDGAGHAHLMMDTQDLAYVLRINGDLEEADRFSSLSSQMEYRLDGKFRYLLFSLAKNYPSVFFTCRISGNVCFFLLVALYEAASSYRRPFCRRSQTHQKRRQGH